MCNAYSSCFILLHCRLWWSEISYLEPGCQVQETELVKGNFYNYMGVTMLLLKSGSQCDFMRLVSLHAEYPGSWQDLTLNQQNIMSPAKLARHSLAFQQKVHLPPPIPLAKNLSFALITISKTICVKVFIFAKPPHQVLCV